MSLLSTANGEIARNAGPRHNLLVIKLGALGDFIQATGAYAALRAAHPDDHIVLLTTKPFEAFARTAPFFDDVWIDRRPKLWQVSEILRLRARLRGGKFWRVYDLQTSDRSSFYRHLLGHGPEWSGIARGCSHPHDNPRRTKMHTLDRLADQLAGAGIVTVPAPDLSWVRGETQFSLPETYALIVYGCARHRPEKRWPAERYGELSRRLCQRGIVPVLIGANDEADTRQMIRQHCPAAMDLSGQTQFEDIVDLARKAVFAIGNDTGPMHLVAASGCPSIVLFSRYSNPEMCAPRGRVAVIPSERLADLPVAQVEEAISQLLNPPSGD